MDTVGEQLRALRQRTPHTVRSVATFLGFENHSRYSYYEGKRFKKPLPVELAKRLAELFYRSGKVEPQEVLQLAGLLPAEAAHEQEQLLAGRRPPANRNVIQLHVQLPSAEALTQMFEGMLHALGQSALVDELAARLAQLLPVALSATPVVPFDQSGVEERVFAAHLLQAAIDGPEWR